MIKDLMKIFDSRRQQLILTLQNKSDGLALEKQHQIYGAIAELEVVMKTLNYHHDKWINDPHKVEYMSQQQESEIRQALDNQIQELKQQAFERIPDQDESFAQKFRRGE